MNDLEKNGNLIEAVLWGGFALIFAIKAWRAAKDWRRLFTILAFAFLVFGLSDVIESRTGAWWRPFWLFIMKAACVGVFLYGVWKFRQLKRNKGIRPSQ